MANKEIEVVVVGGAIGGLAAAISLLQAGFDVHVYEHRKTARRSNSFMPNKLAERVR